MDFLVLKDDSGEVIAELPILVASDVHRNYIISTWVRSQLGDAQYWRISPVPSHVQLRGLRSTKELYRVGESAVAEAKWKRSRVITNDEGTVIHGWIAFEPSSYSTENRQPHLYHVYVPPQLRTHGIARALIKAYCGDEFTVHKPLPYEFIDHVHKDFKITWNPWGVLL